jgi:hypothetical protein
MIMVWLEKIDGGVQRVRCTRVHMLIPIILSANQCPVMSHRTHCHLHQLTMSVLRITRTYTPYHASIYIY